VTVDVKGAPGSRDRIPLLNVLWIFGSGEAPGADALARGAYGRRPLAVLDCGGRPDGGSEPAGPPRGVVMLIERGGAGAIRVAVRSREPLFAEGGGSVVYRSGRRFLAASSPWEKVVSYGAGAGVGANTGSTGGAGAGASTSAGSGAGATGDAVHALDLVFPASVAEAALYVACGHEAGDVDLAWAQEQEARAIARWNSLDLPYGRIRVPDNAIQALLDASVRTIFQAGGGGAARVAEVLAMLGCRDEARACVERLLRGGLPGEVGEDGDDGTAAGTLLHAVGRHALLTRDGPWLDENWYALQEGVAAIRAHRDAGLVAAAAPPATSGATYSVAGSADAGAAWCLAGLRSAIDAARALGRERPEMLVWEAELADLADTMSRGTESNASEAPDGTARTSAAALYGLASEASPLLTWSNGSGAFSPNIGAAAEFIRLARCLLANEHGEELHLLEGLPASWLRPGAEIELSGAATEFGPLSLKLVVAADGRTAELAINPPPGLQAGGLSAGNIVVHLGPWAADGSPSVMGGGERLLVRIMLGG